MTIASGHGCSAPRAISDSSSTDSSATRTRCGLRNASDQRQQAHSPVLRIGFGRPSVGRPPTSSFGIGSGTMRLSLESATYSHPRRGCVDDARRRAERHAPLLRQVAHDAVGADGAHALVVEVRDENRELAGRRRIGDNGDAGRSRQPRVFRRSFVAGVAPDAAAGDGRDDAGARVHLAHAVVVHVGDVDVAVGRLPRRRSACSGARPSRVRRRPRRRIRLAGRRRATVWIRPRLRIDLPHAVVERVGDVDVAVGRRGHCARRVERGFGRRLVVAVVSVRRPSRRSW